MNPTSTLPVTNSATTGLPVDIPDWALAEEPDSLGRLVVSPTLDPDALHADTSTHTLGDGVVADPQWPWDPNAADLYAQLLGEPWRAPGTRLIGHFKTADEHTCGELDNIAVLMFVNPTDVVFGTCPTPIWTVVWIDYVENRHMSTAYADPRNADELFHLLVADTETGCYTC